MTHPHAIARMESRQATANRDRRMDLDRLLSNDVDRPGLAAAAAIYLTLSDPERVSRGDARFWVSGSLPPRSRGGSAGRSPGAQHALTTHQTIFLRKLARKTWAFFEQFVGPDDHWLPPDNYQEHPVATVAHRTSPTNMGLALLANLSAYDFGYMSAGQLIERTTNAFHTMEALERHRGHFYNWYDTQSLKPLLPTYVSTVDSGNLAGHLLTLRPGLLALPDQKILGPTILRRAPRHTRCSERRAQERRPLRLSCAQFQTGSCICKSRPTRSRQRASALTGWRRRRRSARQLEGCLPRDRDLVGARTCPAMP